MIAMTKTVLKTLRDSLAPKASQEEIARAANITLATYRNAEAGKNVSYSTAIAILQAMNAARATRELGSISLEDLGLHIV
jgi:transcriptional regulator with XRE-family HTH domain